jgi:transmembrane sensor
VGEGYFEVAASLLPSTRTGRNETNSRKDPLPGGAGQPLKRKFIVSANGMDVEVLGTKFNIQSYPDEDDKRATLVEGKVNLVAGDQSRILSPGEQAMVSKNGNIEIRKVDTEEVTGWKEGWFIFRDEPIESVLSQIRRWYNVDVHYSGGVDDHFNVSVRRDEKLGRLLNILEKIGHVHFELQGRILVARR